MALSKNCWKYLVLIYNVLLGMSAAALFGVSGYLLYRLFVYRHFIGASVQYPAILMVLMGAVLCSVAWVGYRSATTTHRFHVIMAGVLLLVAVLVEFGTFVWAMVVWERMDLEVKHAVSLDFELATRDHDHYAITRWDRMQYQLKCCGVGGPSDYRAANSLPYSCCGQGLLEGAASAAVAHAPDCAAMYQRGCATPLYLYARHHALLVAMLALLAAVLQSSGVFCTLCLAHALGRGGGGGAAPGYRARACAGYEPALPVAEASLLSAASTRKL